MRNVQVDRDGELRCWNCGAKGLIAQRTMGSKVMFGVGALLANKKLRCMVCGEYNQTGNADPYGGQTTPPPRPGWHPDPTGEFRLRYWNGTIWTSHTAK